MLYYVLDNNGDPVEGAYENEWEAQARAEVLTEFGRHLDLTYIVATEEELS
jgi:hypothetical protein